MTNICLHVTTRVYECRSRAAHTVTNTSKIRNWVDVLHDITHITILDFMSRITCRFFINGIGLFFMLL